MSAILAGSLSVFVFFLLSAMIAIKIKRNDLADVMWGLGFVVAMDGGIFFRENHVSLGPVEMLIVFCVTLWGLRLFWYLGSRFLSKKTEDARYANWRKEWGSTWIWRSLLQVWTLQPALLLLIVLPVLSAIDRAPLEITLWVQIGLIFWMLGFLFESLGDYQLKKFLRDPANKGQLMTKGLWSWTRHPNYFGEVTQWWGIFLMAATLDTWWLIISPLTITFFILKISGVTMLEKLMENRPGFADYQRRTSKFFPLPPKT
jgi:steroid 5-alpha reductase family enzyme